MKDEVLTSQPIPKSVNLLANTFLTILAIVCASAFLYGVYFGATTFHRQVTLAIAFAFFILLLRFRTPLRVRILLATISVLMALYGLESFLRIYQNYQKEANLYKAAARISGTVDTRTKQEVVRGLRHKGISAFPSPIGTLSSNPGTEELRSRVTIDGLETVPLGGISNKTTVLCNEIGQYVVYESDEHGYNNPKGIWASPPLQIAAVGDSFTHGQCVSPDKNVVAVIKNHYASTINLGMSGVGPLRNLGAIQEYLPTLRPRVVIWFHYEGNDFLDLEYEKNSPLLKLYLTKGFNQGLLKKQLEIDHGLEAIVDKEFGDHEPGSKDITFASVMDFLTVSNLRTSLYFTFGIYPRLPADADYELLRKILATAQRTVESWGGTLYFVYLPTDQRYYSKPAFGRSLRYDEIRQRVSTIARELGLPVIDLHDAFMAQGGPQKLFFYPGSHYNEDGYRVAAQSVLDAINNSHALN